MEMMILGETLSASLRVKGVDVEGARQSDEDVGGECPPTRLVIQVIALKP